uniref:Coiled-coil domain containing 136b n=1 Tax=Sphenodon punctatus TaxID=8508 RepID=A0A8D0L4X7_SPHPU
PPKHSHRGRLAPGCRWGGPGDTGLGVGSRRAPGSLGMLRVRKLSQGQVWGCSGVQAEGMGCRFAHTVLCSSAGDVDTPNLEENEEEEEEEEEEVNAGSVEEEEEDEKELELSEQEMEALRAQMLQLLEELEETRELALKHEDDSLELQGLLEDERLASAHQAEIFTKQIQRLQGQFHGGRGFESLQDVKETELHRAQRQLLEASEKIHDMQLEVEESAALHENEIAGLQEELCRLRAELQRIQRTRDEYEMEITSLRAEITMKSSSHISPLAALEPSPQQPWPVCLAEELDTLREQYHDLTDEYLTLQESNRLMVHQLEKLEAQNYRCRALWGHHRGSNPPPPLRGWPVGATPGTYHPPVISLPVVGLVVIVALLWCWWAETSS